MDTVQSTGSTKYTVQSLDTGKYTVCSYIPKETIYGLKYLVTAEHNDATIEFWSNSTLTKYISSTKPTKKFEITVERDNNVDVPYPNKVLIYGYNTEVILK